MSPNSDNYWRANLKLIAGCLLVWFCLSFLCGIVFVEELNQFRVGGYQLGFWFSQQGSIFSFLILIIFYNWRIHKLDQQYRSRARGDQ